MIAGMGKRSALLIGSLPFESEEVCMRRALAVLGPHLRCLPDGEVGEKSPAFPRGNRIAWVMSAIEALTADAECFRVIRPPRRGEDGMAVDYESIQKLTPLRAPAEIAGRVRLGYDRYALRSYETFKRLREEEGRPALLFQVGVPTGFAMGFAFASRVDWVRYTGALSTVIAREVNAVLERAGDDVLVQVEVPPELYAAHMLPSPLLGLAQLPLMNFLGKVRAGARIGVHLCLGDFHNEALIHPKALDTMAAFSNRLVERWPGQHRLAYIHYPLAEGAAAPRLDAGYYRPFKDVRLPAEARFVAGFVHEGRTPDEHRRILGAIEDARGEAVDIACSCGLGRRTPEVADVMLGRMAEMVEA